MTTNNTWVTYDHDQTDNQEVLDEATSGSAWEFYNQYNPQLLDAMQQVLVGNKVEDVVNGLLEADPSLCKGMCSKCQAGTCEVGKKLNCSCQAKAADGKE